MKYKLEIKLPKDLTDVRFQEINNYMLNTLNAKNVYTEQEQQAAKIYKEFLVLELNQDQEPSVNDIAFDYKKFLTKEERAKVKTKPLSQEHEPALSLWEALEEPKNNLPNYDYDDNFELIDTMTFDEFKSLIISKPFQKRL